MRTENRWPVFVARAREAGVGSMLAFQLFVEQQNLGALNVLPPPERLHRTNQNTSA